MRRKYFNRLVNQSRIDHWAPGPVNYMNHFLTFAICHLPHLHQFPPGQWGPLPGPCHPLPHVPHAFWWQISRPWSPPLPGIISPPSDSLCPNPRLSTQMSFSPKVVTFWAHHWWRALTKCLVIKSGSLNHHWLTLSTMFLCLQFHDHCYGAGAAMERISNELRSSWSSTSRENKNIRVRFPWAVWSASTSVKKMSNKLKIKMNLRWETLIHWKLYQGLNHEHMC